MHTLTLDKDKFVEDLNSKILKANHCASIKESWYKLIIPPIGHLPSVILLLHLPSIFKGKTLYFITVSRGEQHSRSEFHLFFLCMFNI